MKLSDCAAYVPLKIMREGVFESLGFIDHLSKARLVFCEEGRYLADLDTSADISCVITNKALAESVPDTMGVGVTDNPRRAFFTVHNHLAANTDFYLPEKPTNIAESARIHPTAYVADRNVEIGERVVVEPHAVIFNHSVLADDVIVRAGAIVGSEGFQFEKIDGDLLKVVHTGGVKLGKGVELQSRSCVDRAVFGGYTNVGEYTKTDNMVHIAHNVIIGRRCRLAAAAVLAGSVILGNDVWIGPGAVLSSGIRVGDGARITLGAVVTRNVAANQHVSGNFAVDHAKFLDFIRTIR